MNRVAVVGATGYAGAELVRILAGHPATNLTLLVSRQYAGQRFDTVYPSMAGVVAHTCESLSVARIAEVADIVFTALPHRVPMTIVPDLLDRGKKVIDLSADFRFKNPSTYETHYQAHTAADLLEKTVYGLSEIYTEQIKPAVLVGNPGCYPTSLLLPLVPLIRNGLIDVDTIIADSKSGVSGAGRSPSLTTHYCEAAESFKAYKVAEHRHNPEMEEIISREAGTNVRITFVPHLVPMSRGMLTTVYASTAENSLPEAIRECLNAFYAGHPFVRICPENRMPDTRNVRGTNFCDIGLKVDRRNNRLVLISAIDNLVKGAAGQAVQNMNIMLGLDQKTGLEAVSYPV